MSQRPQTHTPEQQEALKCATAFAYGYCQAMYEATSQTNYLERVQRIRAELKEFGCFNALQELNQPYFAHRLRGLAKATLELAKVGLS